VDGESSGQSASIEPTEVDPGLGFDPTQIASTVAGLAGWPFGPIRVEQARRIGTEHGLSGTVHRVHGRTEAGKPVAFIVKRDEAAGVERALAFHAAMGERLVGWIPACYGGSVDEASGVGTLYLEDVHPATQGDVLVDPGPERARAAIRTIARVHAASWRARSGDYDAKLDRWDAVAWDVDRWRDRLTGARARFPDLLTAAVARRLTELPNRVTEAATTLGTGPSSWVHGDAHLDNILWRPDGRAVLLDWAGARIGPPTVDVARFLVEGPAGPRTEPARGVALIAAYQLQLREGGVSAADVARVVGLTGLAMWPLAQSIIGWAGRPETIALDARMARLRENAISGVVAWLEQES
jgi:aminoglycoside phosphotransferase (APT) family kinase protein